MGWLQCAIGFEEDWLRGKKYTYGDVFDLLSSKGFCFSLGPVLNQQKQVEWTWCFGKTAKSEVIVGEESSWQEAAIAIIEEAVCACKGVKRTGKDVEREEMSRYLKAAGFVLKDGMWVRYSNPRVGYVPETGELIIGCSRKGYYTTCIELLEEIDKLDHTDNK